jgi:S1-C subfamily serine protease
MGAFEVDALAVTGILTRTIDDDLLPPPKSIGTDTLLGVLPSGFLHHFMVTIDFGQNKLRLDAKKDDALAEAPGMFVTGISLEETMSSPVHVTGVLPGSAAADAGIAAGDEIATIEGKAIGDIDAFTRPFRLASPQNGATVHVEILKAGASAPTAYTLDTRDLLKAP